MAYVQVPKDLSKVKTKFIFNLTKRQAICFAIAAAIGVPTYLVSKGILGNTIAATIMIMIMLPFFFFAMYEKDGRPLEKILKNIIEAKFRRPGIRVYRTENMYGKLQEKYYEGEVLGIGEDDYKKATFKGRIKEKVEK